MRDTQPTAAPNFKSACVVMFGVNITWIFMVIWAIWGLIFVMLLGWVINHMMTRVHAYSITRAAMQRANPKARARW